MSEKQTFEVLLEKDENLHSARITVPLDAEKFFGTKRVPIKLSVNGAFPK